MIGAARALVGKGELLAIHRSFRRSACDKGVMQIPKSPLFGTIAGDHARPSERADCRALFLIPTLRFWSWAWLFPDRLIALLLAAYVINESVD
jgi:hypothetical protein